MSVEPPKRIELVEYKPALFEARQISNDVGELLWQNYRRQLSVEFPSPRTGGRWQLTPQGWAGQIPVTPDLRLVLQPKVEITNLFRMLAYAYRLGSFYILPGLVDCQSFEEFYERLARLLANRVLERTRLGLYQVYAPKTEELPYVRGRIAVAQMLDPPGQVQLCCRYHDRSADVEENHILAWTLFCLARSGLVSEHLLPTVGKAFRALRSEVTVKPVSPDACLHRSYNRLNDDYRALHALCRFILELSGPGHRLGDRSMLPFLVNMARLYEMFVAEWLKANLPPQLTIKVQEPVANTEVEAVIDLVLYDTNDGTPRFVLDTKYKHARSPANEDIFQIVAYAKAKRCRQAILIYPAALAKPLDTMWADIHVRSLTFALQGDLDVEGRKFLKALAG